MFTTKYDDLLNISRILQLFQTFYAIPVILQGFSNDYILSKFKNLFRHLKVLLSPVSTLEVFRVSLKPL
jgi:hypothetical protein